MGPLHRLLTQTVLAILVPSMQHLAEACALPSQVLISALRQISCKLYFLLSSASFTCWYKDCSELPKNIWHPDDQNL